MSPEDPVAQLFGNLPNAHIPAFLVGLRDQEWHRWQNGIWITALLKGRDETDVLIKNYGRYKKGGNRKNRGRRESTQTQTQQVTPPLIVEGGTQLANLEGNTSSEKKLKQIQHEEWKCGCGGSFGILWTVGCFCRAQSLDTAERSRNSRLQGILWWSSVLSVAYKKTSWIRHVLRRTPFYTRSQPRGWSITSKLDLRLSLDSWWFPFWRSFTGWRCCVILDRSIWWPVVVQGNVAGAETWAVLLQTGGWTGHLQNATATRTASKPRTAALTISQSVQVSDEGRGRVLG